MTQARSAMTGTVAHLRPSYHIRPPRGYLNDPNGPIEVGPQVHLYFQSRPTIDLGTPVEWGHVTSTDYVRWTLHRPAMAPVPDGPDRDGCWSGNTVWDGDRIRAFYSGMVIGRPYQSVLTAVSDDGGNTFGRPEQAIPDPMPGEQVLMFRDPFVWREHDAWWMAVGVGYADRGAGIALYRSADLRDWTAEGALAELPRSRAAGDDTGSAWECPQVLTVDGRRIAVVSSWSPEGGANQVLSFDLDAPISPQRADHGTNFYAASALRDSRFGTVLFGWLTEGRDHPDGWAGVISLPRVVRRGPDDSLRSAPVPTVDTLRIGPGSATDGVTTTPHCEIDVPSGSGRVVVHFGDQERLELELEEAAGTLTIDRSRASLDSAAHGGRMQAIDAFDHTSGRPAARIFLDGSVVEVFTSAGRVLSTRVYPIAPPPWTIEAPPNARHWFLIP